MFHLKKDTCKVWTEKETGEIYLETSDGKIIQEDLHGQEWTGDLTRYEMEETITVWTFDIHGTMYSAETQHEAVNFILEELAATPKLTAKLFS